MDSSHLEHLISIRSGGELEAYLGGPGTDLVRALERRLEWAIRNVTSDANGDEAEFLLAHANELRERVTELSGVAVTTGQDSFSSYPDVEGAVFETAGICLPEDVQMPSVDAFADEDDDPSFSIEDTLRTPPGAVAIFTALFDGDDQFVERTSRRQAPQTSQRTYLLAGITGGLVTLVIYGTVLYLAG